MSIRLQNEIEVVAKTVKTHTDAIVELAYDVSQLKEAVESLQEMLVAITRASTPQRGK